MNSTRSLVSEVHAHHKVVISQPHVFAHRLIVNIEGRFEHRFDSVWHKLSINTLSFQLRLTPTAHRNRCHIRSLAPLQDQRWNRVVVNRCPRSNVQVGILIAAHNPNIVKRYQNIRQLALDLLNSSRVMQMIQRCDILRIRFSAPGILRHNTIITSPSAVHTFAPIIRQHSHIKAITDHAIQHLIRLHPITGWCCR